MPTFGSLFAGIGGIDLGLERAGWECRWQVEIDDYCQAVLRKHWPDVPKYGDVKELTGRELKEVDLIAGGFPCQPTSSAGKRMGEADPRWLWPSFERVLWLLRPRFVLVENPPGLLTHGMGKVLCGLASLGYDAEWESLSAQAFGAPHLRQRVWIVAYTTGERLERGVFPETPRPVRSPSPDCTWWATEPGVRRVDARVPNRVERGRALGNAVVPQIAEWVGKRIIEAMNGSLS